MRQRRRSLRLLFSLSTAAVALVALSVPSLSQTEGGRQATFSLQQGFETLRNPDLEASGEDERRTLSNTDLSYALSTSTRRASLGLTVGARLRGAAGDVDTGESEGFTLDRQFLALRHGYLAPNAEFTTTASVRRADIGFLQRLDLIEDADGNVEVPEDIDDLEGTGTRTNARLSFAAQFGESRPFGWGVSVSNSVLTYEDVENSSLEDSSQTTTRLNARFDLNPVLSLTTALRYQLRLNEGEDTGETMNYDLVLAHRRAENGALRAGITVAQPDDDRETRTTLFVGGTQEITDLRELDFNIGSTMGESGEARFVGLVNYREALSRTTSLNAQLNRQVSDNTRNETVLDTAARLNLLHSLTPRSGVRFGVLYGARENFTTDEDSSDLSVSVSYSHNLTRDWALSVGASHIWRTEDDAEDTTSDRLFFSVGRSWNSRF